MSQQAPYLFVELQVTKKEGDQLVQMADVGRRDRDVGRACLAAASRSTGVHLPLRTVLIAREQAFEAS